MTQLVISGGNNFLVSQTTGNNYLVSESGGHTLVQGIPSPIFGGSDLHYVFNQGIPVLEWIIDHPLGKFPSVSVVDSSGDECEGDVQYNGTSQVIVRFSAPFSGTAYLN